MDKVTDKYVFGTGDRYGITTITSDRKSLKSFKEIGVKPDVFMIAPPRFSKYGRGIGIGTRRR